MKTCWKVPQASNCKEFVNRQIMLLLIQTHLNFIFTLLFMVKCVCFRCLCSMGLCWMLDPHTQLCIYTNGQQTRRTAQVWSPSTASVKSKVLMHQKKKAAKFLLTFCFCVFMFCVWTCYEGCKTMVWLCYEYDRGTEGGGMLMDRPPGEVGQVLSGGWQFLGGIRMRAREDERPWNRDEWRPTTAVKNICPPSGGVILQWVFREYNVIVSFIQNLLKKCFDRIRYKKH